MNKSGIKLFPKLRGFLFHLLFFYWMFTRRVTSLGASPFRRYFSTTANEVSELLKGYQTVVVKEIEWGDMDAFNHVNNVNYLRYFEWVRVRHMSAIAIIANERSFLSPRGVGPILGDIYCRYKVI